MVTKKDAKAAWQTILAFSAAHNSKTSFSAADITKTMQDAIVILNDYFTEEDKHGKEQH